MDDLATVRRARQAAENRVRQLVMQCTLDDLPAPSLRQKLEASHEHLETTVSPIALAAALRVA